MVTNLSLTGSLDKKVVGSPFVFFAVDFGLRTSDLGLGIDLGLRTTDLGLDIDFGLRTSDLGLAPC